MLDPISLGVALMIIAVMVAIIFYFTSGGDDFEKAFDENARKLISQEKEKPKAKGKTTKKKDGKDKKSEKGDTDRDTPDVDHILDEIKKENTLIETSPLVSAPEKKKTAGKKEKVPSDPSPVPKEAMKDDSPAKTEPAYAHEKTENNAESEGKKKKSNKPKKEEPAPLSPKAHVSFVDKETSSKVETKKQKKVHVINAAELDSNKVMARLANLEEVEPEYIGYLATYFHDSNAKNISLTESLAKKTAAENELKNKAEMHKNARLVAEKRIVADLTTKLANAVTAETAKQQMAQLINLRQENDTLKAALTNSAITAAEGKKTRELVESLKADLAKSVTHANNLQSDLDKQLKDYAKLARKAQESEDAAVFIEKQKAEMNELKNTFTTLDLAARSIKAELDEKNNIIEEMTQKSSADDIRRVEQEREELTGKFNKEKLEWTQKEAHLMEEYQSLQALVNELHKEVAKFETFKLEQDKLTAELAVREARIAELEKGVSSNTSSSNALEKENKELKSKLDELVKKMEANSAQHSAEVASLRAQLDEKPSVEEEIVVLSAAPVDASPVSSGEVEGLKKENRRLMDKNEELRRRNFKILDDVTTLEKSLACVAGTSGSADKKNDAESKLNVTKERELVKVHIGSLVNATQLGKDADQDSYSSWLRDISVSLKDKITSTSKSTLLNEHKPKEAVEHEVETYRSALASLSSELSRIEEISNQKTAEYESKIEQLQSKLKSANLSIVSMNRLKVELRECGVLKKQISDLRESLHGSGKGDFVDVSPSHNRSDESDWEVVN